MWKVVGDFGGLAGWMPGIEKCTVKLWKQYINGMEMVNQFFPETQMLVLDGIPRNVEQAKLLEDTVEVVKVIHLVCADMGKMIERLKRRALKENRFDDANDKVIQHRLEVYEQETHPVLNYYPPEKIVRIDATMSQIRVLSKTIDVLVPLKEEMDRAWEKSEAATAMKNPPSKTALATAGAGADE